MLQFETRRAVEPTLAACQAIHREEIFAAVHGTTRDELQALPPMAKRIANRLYLAWCASL